MEYAVNLNDIQEYNTHHFFINDATTTINEDLHLATLKNLAFGFAYVQDTQDLINDIKESR